MGDQEFMGRSAGHMEGMRFIQQVENVLARVLDSHSDGEVGYIVDIFRGYE